MRSVYIEDVTTVIALRECGYFCEHVPGYEGSLWYETDWPLEHLQLGILPNGVGLVLAGARLFTQEAFDLDMQKELRKLQKEYPYLPLSSFPTPALRYIPLPPQPEKQEPLVDDRPSTQYTS